MSKYVLLTGFKHLKNLKNQVHISILVRANLWRVYRVNLFNPAIPKTFKMVLDTSLLNTQQYKVRIKGKVEQSRETSSALPYWKGSLLVTLDSGHQLYFTYLYHVTEALQAVVETSWSW